MFRKNPFFKTLVSLMAISLIALTACEEENNLASAQKCLDEVNEENDSATVKASVQVCLDKISGDDSPSANVIKCAGKFIQGGLTTQRIVSSAEKLNNTEDSKKEAAMITAMALGSMTDAQEASEYCKKSELDGLIYLSSLSLIGTAIMKGSLNDNMDATQLAAALTDCKDNGCNDAAVGSAIITVGSSYCSGSQSDSEVCGELNQAISAGATPEEVADQYYSLINK